MQPTSLWRSTLTAPWGWPLGRESWLALWSPGGSCIETWKSSLLSLGPNRASAQWGVIDQFGDDSHAAFGVRWQSESSTPLFSRARVIGINQCASHSESAVALRFAGALQTPRARSVST